MIPSINACKLALHLLDRERVQYELQSHIALHSDNNPDLGSRLAIMACDIQQVQSMLMDRIRCGRPQTKKRKDKKR